MSAYLIVRIKILDPERWSVYRLAVGPCMERFGGNAIARGADLERLEGSDDGQRVSMFEFPSMGAIRTFWQSPDYAAVKRLREGAADLDAWAVPGV